MMNTDYSWGKSHSAASGSALYRNPLDSDSVSEHPAGDVSFAVHDSFQSREMSGGSWFCSTKPYPPGAC